MSFSDFMQWLRNFFSRSTSSEATPPLHPEPTPPEHPVTPTDGTSEETSISPSPPETETPPVTTSPPPTPEPVAPIIIAIDTDGDKVPVDTDITFQITTKPFGQYDNCTLDLQNTHNATLISDLDTDGRFTIRFHKVSTTDNDTQTIRVSNPDSTIDKAITVSLMKLFWSHHPGRRNVCDETRFTNQCAIRMGAALELSGIKLPADRRILRRCTTEYQAYKHHKDGKVKGHVLAAQELANWIKSQPTIFGQRSIVHNKDEILGRSGILFFRDGWGTTDHIDVWDGQNLVGGFPSYFDSDFKELWFWDIY